MDYSWDFSIVTTHKGVLLKGLVVTLELTIIIIILSTILGFVLGFLLNTKIRPLSYVLKIFVDSIRSLPLLIFLFWCYYFVPPFLGFERMSAFWIAVIAFTINMGCFIADIVRASILNLNRQHVDAALSVGMTRVQVLKTIVIPDVFYNILPSLSFLYIQIFKQSSLASVIAIHELTHSANLVILETFHSIEIYTAIGLIYILIVFPLSYFSRGLELRFSTDRKVNQDEG